MEIFTKVTCPAARRFRCPSFDKHSEKWTRFESSEHYRKNDLGLLFCNRRWVGIPMIRRPVRSKEYPGRFSIVNTLREEIPRSPLRDPEPKHMYRKASSEEVAMAAEMFCALVPLAESLTASCAKHVESNGAAFQCTGHMEGRALSAFSRRRKTEETIPSARKLFLYHEASRGETMRINARKPINVCAHAD